MPTGVERSRAGRIAGDTVSSGRATLGRRQEQTLQSREPNHRKKKRLPTAVPSRYGQCCLEKVVREQSAW